MNEQDEARHDAVYQQAVAVYRERDAVRQGLWEQYNPEDQLVQAKIKIERCLHALRLGRPEDVIKEAPDVLNYTIFAVRQCEDRLDPTGLAHVQIKPRYDDKKLGNSDE